MSGSGISWAICKSAPRSRQTTTPAPHHSKFFKAGCALPAAQPTASKHWRHNINNISNLIIITAAIQLTSGHHQVLKIVFYPHDAVLTRHESKSCVCHKLVFYWNGWMMELVSLAWRLPLTYPTLQYREIWVSAKIMLLPSGNLSKLCSMDIYHCSSIVTKCCQVSWTQVDAQCDKLATHTHTPV